MFESDDLYFGQRTSSPDFGERMQPKTVPGLTTVARYVLALDA